jgi:hypothetical protein
MEYEVPKSKSAVIPKKTSKQNVKELSTLQRGGLTENAWMRSGRARADQISSDSPLSITTHGGMTLPEGSVKLASSLLRIFRTCSQCTVRRGISRVVCKHVVGGSRAAHWVACSWESNLSSNLSQHHNDAIIPHRISSTGFH